MARQVEGTELHDPRHCRLRLDPSEATIAVTGMRLCWLGPERLPDQQAVPGRVFPTGIWRRLRAVSWECTCCLPAWLTHPSLYCSQRNGDLSAVAGRGPGAVTVSPCGHPSQPRCCRAHRRSLPFVPGAQGVPGMLSSASPALASAALHSPPLLRLSLVAVSTVHPDGLLGSGFMDPVSLSPLPQLPLFLDPQRSPPVPVCWCSPGRSCILNPELPQLGPAGTAGH